MFIHNFKYTLLTLLKNKMLIFWTFAFPIILGTFFYMAFSDIESSEHFQSLDIAVVDNDDFKKNTFFKEAIKTLSDVNNKEQIFNTNYVDEKEAETLLESKKIVGYIKLNPTAKIVVKENGTSETILKQVVEHITKTSVMFEDITSLKIDEMITKNPQVAINLNAMYESIYKETNDLLNTKANIKDTTNNKLSYTMIEYYTLIAMACLYGGILGMNAINKCLANMSNLGKRVSISPAKKSTFVLSSALASFLLEALGVFLLLAYTIFVLKVDYGSHILLVMLLSFVGCFAGLSLGICLSSVLKSNENLKLGIILAVTMFGCFLSGMMGITMKYIVDKNIPILNKINPASMITDGFYSLYYYDTFNRYYFNIVSLIIFSAILLVIASIHLRRQKYDSI